MICTIFDDEYRNGWRSGGQWRAWGCRKVARKRLEKKKISVAIAHAKKMEGNK